MRRQDILYDSTKTFEFVFTEAALRILSCPRHVMLGQLDRLLSLSADNAKIGIIPFGTELTITPVNGFLLLGDQLIVETYGWEDQEHGDESATHRRIFDMLMTDALKDDEARRLIARAAKDLPERKLREVGSYKGEDGVPVPGVSRRGQADDAGPHVRLRLIRSVPGAGAGPTVRRSYKFRLRPTSKQGAALGACLEDTRRSRASGAAVPGRALCPCR
jgi:hypothetical protein